MFKSVFSVFLFVFIISVSGCGSAEYEARLRETADYYDYLNDKEKNLGNEWKSSGEITGLRLHPPVGFKPLSPPKQETDEEGNLLEIEEDPRQPMNISGFYDGELPGLAGCFRKQVEVEVGNSETTKKVIMYLYVLARPIGASESGDFYHEVIGQLAVDLNADGPDEGDWDEQAYPSLRKYDDQQTYQIATLTAGNPVNSLPENQTDFELYMTSGSDKEVILLYVYPNSGMKRSDSSALTTGRKYSLQSLEISRSKSKKSSTGGSPSQKSNNVTF